MEQSLFLGREVLDGNAEELRRILLDHTESERAATDLLVALFRAREGGSLSWCMLFSRADEGDEDRGHPWKVHFGYDADLSAEAVPA